MAGIGFELKDVFDKKGVFPLIKGYGYATLSCIGPLSLGILLQLSLFSIGNRAGIAKGELDLFTVMINYIMVASLLVNSFFSTFITRHISDLLDRRKYKKIMPVFWGNCTILIAVGGVLFGAFLLFSGIAAVEKLLCLFIFLELIVSWVAINHLAALKVYKHISFAFFCALLLGVLCAVLAILVVGIHSVRALLFCIFIAYGSLMLWYCVLLTRYFPGAEGSIFAFLQGMQQNSYIGLIGFLSNIGLFSHLIIMWFSKGNLQIQGLFYSAPGYDIPAFFAFISIFASMVNYTILSEVSFYPHYKRYMGLISESGSIKEIELARGEMTSTLARELEYVCIKQIVVTFGFVVFGGLFLEKIGMGFTSNMISTFQLLCAAYAIYILANIFMTILLYFADTTGALACIATFTVCNAAFTFMVSRGIPVRVDGLGFLLAATLYYLMVLARLMEIVSGVQYYILGRQPLVLEEKTGFWTRLCKRLQRLEQKRAGKTT